jgi:hypothetical protein
MVLRWILHHRVGLPSLSMQAACACSCSCIALQCAFTKKTFPRKLRLLLLCPHSTRYAASGVSKSSRWRYMVNQRGVAGHPDRLVGATQGHPSTATFWVPCGVMGSWGANGLRREQGYYMGTDLHPRHASSAVKTLHTDGRCRGGGRLHYGRTPNSATLPRTIRRVYLFLCPITVPHYLIYSQMAIYLTSLGLRR